MNELVKLKSLQLQCDCLEEMKKEAEERAKQFSKLTSSDQLND